MPADPFTIESSSSQRGARAAATIARPLLNWLLQLHTYRRLYHDTQHRAAGPFEDRALNALGIEPAMADAELALVPSSGPLIVAANHPHGALDGLLLASVIRRRRSDVRVLTNFLLSRIPELADLCLFVDPFGGRAASVRSQAGLRAAHLWLKNGGALIVFPAGEVAHTRGPERTRSDSPWHATVGRLALATGAPALPAFIEGTNSRLFYAAGHLHAGLRTALLARELLNKRGSAVRVRLGTPIPARVLGQSAVDATRATKSIRSAVEALGHTGKAHDRERLAVEIGRLPAESRLVSSGDFDVFAVNAEQIPAALQEIGRLREITYRAVGEGTGRKVDLDRFDRHYVHLFAWDRAHQQVVGAYRIGKTDQILATLGVNGLYTRTLFRYDERLIRRLTPALELGRSFVRAEYQKNYTALLVLWKGICQFVVRHPRYRVLFGPVSVSARYSDSSHRLLMAFLQQNHRAADLAALVEGINPRLPAPSPDGVTPASIEEVDRLVTSAESDGKGVPILLRQYLKLNARLLGFNVDPQFGDALDALMMVDLTAVDGAILNRYFGRADAATYLAHHRRQQAPHAA